MISQMIRRKTWKPYRYQCDYPGCSQLVRTTAGLTQHKWAVHGGNTGVNRRPAANTASSRPNSHERTPSLSRGFSSSPPHYSPSHSGPSPASPAGSPGRTISPQDTPRRSEEGGSTNDHELRNSIQTVVHPLLDGKFCLYHDITD